MTKEEQAKKIEEIYNEAMEKLSSLGVQRKEIIGKYVRELEDGKISAIKASLELSFNQE